MAAPVVELDTAPGNDSTYGEYLHSFTTSLTSSIKDHEYENGRRYHSWQSGQYFGPNDDAENDRMDMHSHLSSLLLDGNLHLAPIGYNPQRILDLGTGTGIWAIDIADHYPSAEVIGIDLSPTQPSMVPPNIRFEVGDFEGDWTYPQAFDYIHGRFLAGSVANPTKLASQVYKHLQPGGWVEFKDWDFDITSPDDSIPKDSYLAKYHELLSEACKKVGRNLSPGPTLKKLVTDAGFVKVEEKVMSVPIGLWAKDKKMKEIGAWNYICLSEGLEAIILRLATQVLGWQIDEVQALLGHVRKELKDKSIHVQYTYYVVYGQKPDESKEATPVPGGGA